MTAETYHRAFTMATDDRAPVYVLSTDRKLLPEEPTWSDTMPVPLTFNEVQALAAEWSARGDHVIIRTATSDYAFPPRGRDRSRDEQLLDAFMAVGPDSFVAAMVEEPVEELPF